jgi:tRNA A37 threonylcarbamoyladenosine biosynthesis protein TsaE
VQAVGAGDVVMVKGSIGSKASLVAAALAALDGDARPTSPTEQGPGARG